MDELAKLNRLLQTPGLTDLVFIGADFAQGDFGLGLSEVESPFASNASMSAAMITLALEAGSRLDIAKPIADFSYLGARFNAVLAQGVSSLPLLSIRLHPKSKVLLSHLEQIEMISPAQHRFLLMQLAQRNNILIAGATSSGKTTLLGAMLNELDERVIVLEQTPELLVRSPAFAMTERISNQEGAGEIALDSLVVSALRMRPDRIVVGEVRSIEFKVLLQAMNNGHRGTLATLHAASLNQIPNRVSMLGILSGLSEAVTHRMVCASVDLFIQLGKVGDKRKLVAMGRPVLGSNGMSVSEFSL